MNEPARTIVVLRSAAGAPAAVSALRLAETAHLHGQPVTVVLVQDAVLCALQVSGLPGAARLRELIAAGARCHYLAEDLAMRGFEDADVAAGCAPLDYDGLVDVLLADAARVAGAF